MEIFRHATQLRDSDKGVATLGWAAVFSLCLALTSSTSSPTWTLAGGEWDAQSDWYTFYLWHSQSREGQCYIENPDLNYRQHRRDQVRPQNTSFTCRLQKQLNNAMNHETTFLRQITADDVAVVQLQLVGGTFVMVTINSQVRRITIVVERREEFQFQTCDFYIGPPQLPHVDFYCFSKVDSPLVKDYLCIHGLRYFSIQLTR